MELRALHRQGWSKSELSREFGLNRRTVARYIEAEEPPAYRQRPYPAGLSPDQRASWKTLSPDWTSLGPTASSPGEVVNYDLDNLS
jgi:transposase